MKEYASDSKGHTVTDTDFPGIVGKGRTLTIAERNFEHVRETTWHSARVAEVQAIIDELLVTMDRSKLMKIQTMLDDFVGLLRANRTLDLPIGELAPHVLKD